MATSLKNTLVIDPRSVPGCQLWIDIPDSTTTSLGGNLTYVKDKANNVTVSLSGTAPTYSSNLINNIPGITFGGASWLRGNFSSTYTGNNLTVFALCSLNSATAIYGILVSFYFRGLEDYI